jgi:hypothetical protein
MAERIYAALTSGNTYYAKPAPIVDSPWGDDVETMSEDGTVSGWFYSGEIASPDDVYVIFQQAGGSPADTDTLIGPVEMGLAAILEDTNELQTNQGNWATAEGFSTHTASDVLTALGNGSWATEAGGTGDHLTALATQTSVDDLPTNAELDTALAGADDATLAAIAALNDLSAADVNAELLDVIATDTLVDGKSIQAALRYIAAVVAGELSGAGTGEETVTGLDGATNRATFTVDASGNRTAVSYDP